MSRWPARLALAVSATATLTLGLSAAAARPVARSAEAPRPFSGTVTYRETNPGQDRGDASVGVAGRGAFSAKLSRRATFVTRVLGVLTGVPVEQLVKGGTFAARYDIDAVNNYRGLVVATFKARGLGSICLSYTVIHGKFEEGSSYIPANGSFTTVGGTGQAAKIRLSGTFKQGDVSGGDVERLLVSGSLRAGTGPPKAPSKACRAAGAG